MRLVAHSSLACVALFYIKVFLVAVKWSVSSCDSPWLVEAPFFFSKGLLRSEEHIQELANLALSSPLFAEVHPRAYFPEIRFGKGPLSLDVGVIERLKTQLVQIGHFWSINLFSRSLLQLNKGSLVPY